MSDRSNFSLKLGIAALAILVLIILSSKFIAGPFLNRNQVLGLKSPGFELISNFQFTFDRDKPQSELDKIIEANISGKKGEYAFFVESLGSEEMYAYNENSQFPSASLYKLFLMAAVLNEVEQGNLTLESKVSASMSHLEEIFGGVDFGYEQKSGTITYTVQTALERVGRISDNFASIMLTEKIGREKMQKIADDLGTKNTDIKNPIQTTSADIALYFKKLYKGEVVSAKVSEQITHFLSLNQLNNRIPANIPEGIKTVHKTGELSKVRHDAGIVYCCSVIDQKQPKIGTTSADLKVKNPYVIVLMSKDLGDENEDGIETLAEISGEVFQYFSNRKVTSDK